MTTSETIGPRANEVSAMTARQRLIVVLLLGATTDILIAGTAPVTGA
jgi:hypothetical protein